MDHLARVDRERQPQTKNSFNSLHDQWLHALRTMSSELTGKEPETILGEVRIPPVNAALLKRLGNFQFRRGEETFSEAMDSIYSKASTEGLKAL